MAALQDDREIDWEEMRGSSASGDHVHQCPLAGTDDQRPRHAMQCCYSDQNPLGAPALAYLAGGREAATAPCVCRRGSAIVST